MLSEYMRKGMEQKEEIFNKALRENAVPPIKGEITAGKCKWRGIKINHYIETGEECLTQRGIEISPRFKFTFNLDIFK